MWYRRMIAGILIGVGFFGSVPWAEGYPVTWEFAGEVTFLEDDDNLLGGAVELGDPFSGSFTFESTTADANPGDTQIGLYENTILALSGYVGSLPFTGALDGANFIRVVNPSSAIDSDTYRAKLDVSFAGQILDFGLSLMDYHGDTFSSDALVLSPPELTPLAVANFFIVDGSETIPLGVTGYVTSLVPEPGTIALLAGSAVLLCGRRRRTFLAPKRAGGGRRRTWVRTAWAAAVLSTSLPFTVTQTARATDCNGNGVEDSLELAECPQISTVFLMDTSRSMYESDYIDKACLAITQALTELSGSGLTVNWEILRIGASEYECTCCGGLANMYGTTAPGLCDGEELETCGGTDEGDLEDWGVGTAVVAANKNWGPGPRIGRRTALS